MKKIPDLQLFLVCAPKREPMFAYGEPSAAHFAKQFKGVHIPFVIVREQLEGLEIGSFVLPAPTNSLN